MQDLLNIGTYNIHRCVGADHRYDIERIARVIRQLDCDTVGLQEVEHRPGLSLDRRQLEFLANATEMQAVAGQRPDPDCPHYGNALLTRREVGRVRRHNLTFDGREPRGALDVEILVGGQVVRVIVTHLGLRGAERRYQVDKLLSLLREIQADRMVVVLGDINEWLPVGRPVRWLNSHLGKPPGHVRSFPVWAPVLGLDRIWARPARLLLSVRVHRSRDARAASDHFPVKARVATELPRRRGDEARV
ncbi:MAG TPA: endonuclease/exonuclease/phosphatase family protein [Steroidobacteraceae bacterium]